MKYYKVMYNGVALCCIETKKSEEGMIKDIISVIEIAEDEAYEWYDVNKELASYVIKIPDKDIVRYAHNKVELIKMWELLHESHEGEIYDVYDILNDEHIIHGALDINDLDILNEYTK